MFKDVGTFKTEMHIKLVEGGQPFVQSVPRVVPIPLLKPLEKELERLKKLDIIEPIDTPTEWVSPIVVVQRNSKIRLFVDFSRLNKSVQRPHFPIGEVETILAQINGSKYFTKLDTNSRFYQIKLGKKSQTLTTLITPFGRYLFKRVPFGINCGPEYFSILLNRILSGIKGVVSHIDILIHAPSIEQHNHILEEVSKRIEAEGSTLNKEKCTFATQSLTFLGHRLSSKGITVDPERILAIQNFPEPKNKKEVLQFLGMVNFSSRFIPDRSQVLEPLTALLKKNDSTWVIFQQQSFEKVKKQVSISANSSSYGLGACLIQTSEGKNEIVAYASRLLSDTEKTYAKIERKALAWAADKFSEYITGILILLQTDQRPLIQVLQTKPIDELTPRLQRFRIRLMRYDYKIYCSPGKDLVVADALSRNFSADQAKPSENELASEVEAHVRLVVQYLQVKPLLLEGIKVKQAKDAIL
ncbi:hypothetical protein JTB14_018478 [Gonioctena quinquepunctata]|nr:hypothetical protein JTB14_018478 [Gonioctena quinquepunctata]